MTKFNRIIRDDIDELIDIYTGKTNVNRPR